MTKPMMNLRALVERSDDADLFRKMIRFAAKRLMVMEVGAKNVAEYGEKSADRMAQRNDYRERDWPTRAGSVELRIPKHRPELCIIGDAASSGLKNLRRQVAGTLNISAAFHSNHDSVVRVAGL